jgi:hypothetical protein
MRRSKRDLVSGGILGHLPPSQKDRQPPAESWRTPALFNSPPRGGWRWVFKRRGKPLLWPELKWFHLRGGRPQRSILDVYECLRAVVGAKRAKEIFV